MQTLNAHNFFGRLILQFQLPYFLKTNGYNLFENLKRNKTLLLVDTIGYDYESLSSLCHSIGINPIGADGKRRGYGTLVRDYLIKVKVGY